MLRSTPSSVVDPSRTLVGIARRPSDRSAAQASTPQRPPAQLGRAAVRFTSIIKTRRPHPEDPTPKTTLRLHAN